MEDVNKIIDDANTLLDKELFGETIELLSDALMQQYASAKLYRLKGFAFLQLSQNEQAIEQLSEAISLDPGCVVCFNNRGIAWQNISAYTKAVDDFSAAIQLQPEEAGYYINRGNAWRSLDSFDNAINDYTEAIRLGSQNAFVYRNRAIAWYFKSEYDKALSDVTEAIRLDAADDDFFSLRGNVLQVMGDYDSALNDYTEAIRLGSKEPILYRNRGTILYHKSEYGKALSDFNEAIRLDPSSDDFFSWRGDVLLEMGEYDHAFHDYQEAIRLNPQHDEACTNSAHICLIKTEFDKAIYYSTRAIQINQSNALAYFKRGSAWIFQGQFDNGIEDFNESIRLNPDHADSYGNRGFALAVKKKFGLALEDINKALQLNPDEPYYYFYLGTTWFWKYEPKKAIENLSSAIRLKPDFPMAYSNRGVSFYLDKNYDNAILDCTIAIQLNPADDNAYNTRGLAWVEKKEYEKAIADFNAAIFINSSFPGHFYNMGYLQYLLDQHQVALVYLKRAYYLGHDRGQLLNTFSRKYSSPFLLHDTLNQVLDEKNITIYTSELMMADKACTNWLTFLTYIDTAKNLRINDTDRLRLTTIVNFHMGHSINAFTIYDRKIDDDALTLQDQYYFALSAADFLEPTEGILHYALAQVQKTNNFSPEDFYYAGQLYDLANRWEEAEDYLKKAGTFLPAVYKRAGIQRQLKNFPEVRRLAEEIQSLSRQGDDSSFLHGSTPIVLNGNSDAPSFARAFKEKLFYYELQEEINEVRSILLPNTPYKHLEFFELLVYEDGLEEMMNHRLERQNIYTLEKELVRIFAGQAQTLSLPDIEKQIQNNDDAKAIILKTEHYTNRFETSAEKELATKIFKLEYPAGLYLLLIKYFYLHKKITARSAVVLHYYVLKIARQKKDKKTMETIGAELKAWMPLINPALKSALVIKAIIKAWTLLTMEKTEAVVDQFKDYQDFKRRFRSDFLGWWRNDLYTSEIESHRQQAVERKDNGLSFNATLM